MHFHGDEKSNIINDELQITIWGHTRKRKKKLSLIFFHLIRSLNLFKILKLNSNFIELNENSIKSKFNWIWGF